ncbi:conjugal transfer protein TraO [Larkinella sp. C7]|uniref:conjugal transfer protein TraO n=1 Tax=Larkinella sp. C7 TaxID=2576607 RepID=UPI0011113BC3|nr:conjugal transfer protein TraO [Larkinella sp. C7]
MMKRWFFASLLLGNCIYAKAQLHQSGQTAVEVSVGALDGFRLPHQDNFGYFAGIAFSKYHTRYLYWKAGMQLNQKSYAYDAVRIPLQQWLGTAEIYTRILGRVSQSLIINAGIGAAGGYESINSDRRFVEGAAIGNRSKWVVGPTAAIEAEYLLTGNLILVARAKEHYLFRSSVTNTRFNAGIGIKIILPAKDDE